jgi:hypothetical protein
MHPPPLLSICVLGVVLKPIMVRLLEVRGPQGRRVGSRTWSAVARATTTEKYVRGQRHETGRRHASAAISAGYSQTRRQRRSVPNRRVVFQWK